jgi:hypothetical protein
LTGSAAAQLLHLAGQQFHVLAGLLLVQKRAASARRFLNSEASARRTIWGGTGELTLRRWERTTSGS